VPMHVLTQPNRPLLQFLLLLGNHLRLEELQVKIKEYKQTKFMKFWMRDCRTVKAALLDILMRNLFIMKLPFVALMEEGSLNLVDKGYAPCCKCVITMLGSISFSVS